MFSYVFVHQSVCLSMGEQAGPHMTITHEALDLTVKAPALSPLVTSGGHHWKPVQTY